MTIEEKFPKPRSIRNTAKQSMLILGQPDFLYKDRELKETFIVIDGSKKSLGRLSDEVHLALEDLAKGSKTKIIRITKKVKSPVSSIQGYPSISIKKHRKDTMIIVPSSNEASLMEKITKLKELLESKGAITQERCNWICIVDKGKVQVSNEEILKKESIAKIKVQEQSKQETPVQVSTGTNINKKHGDDFIKSFDKEFNLKPVLKEMSEKTKSLRKIAIKVLKEAKL